ncbi:GNAT family N-acetyltransferase [Nonomuraea angiospora]|uniref:GNAT family N-acetyltransferase n=1 Tax=Nonomuraea angiospora TaxID=46172 RepID=UPI0029B350BB|nr:GNAT family N-acetyltransferase [Nonomuraea angiospora]MDX3103983.1 GNAT family N-acetyltransferase [Nonomuraea angiospora]
MTIEWAALSPADMPAIADLARRCVAHDGGLPATTSPSFLERRYVAGTVVGAFADGRLVACGAVRPVGDVSAATGLVDPGHRGQGLGSGLLDRLIGEAGPVRLETESVTPEAHALFLSRGLRQTFAEDVYRRDLAHPLPAVPLPPELKIEEWSQDTEGAFYAAYSASFADRPGFPGWSREEWVDWLVDDEFLPGCSLVAREAGGAAGFVTCAEGFLIQVGAVPGWRRRGLARALAAAALDRMRARGATEAFLDVNVNNPASAALFRGLGFEVIARRARYE